MDLENFYNGIKTLNDWFNKKLSTVQEDIILKSVKFIPNKAWDDIIERYTKRLKPLPSNFPTPEEFISAWHIWRNENPDLVRKSFTPTQCDECYGRGLFWFKFYYEPLQKVYEKSVRCSLCENWKQHFNQFCKIPFKTRQELLEDPLILDVWPWKEV